MDAILEEVPGSRRRPFGSIIRRLAHRFGIREFRRLRHSWHWSNPARIDILLHLSEHKKSTEISVLIFTITQTAMFVKYPLVGARESG